MARNIPSNKRQRPVPRLLYPERLSFKMEGEIRCFPDKRKRAERIYLHQTNIARDAKGTALRKGRKTERQRGTQVQKNGNE